MKQWLPPWIWPVSYSGVSIHRRSVAVAAKMVCFMMAALDGSVFWKQIILLTVTIFMYTIFIEIMG